MVTLTPAAALPFAELVEVWNAAYAGYFVPLNFDEAMLARHIRRSGIDLERSVVGEIEGRRFGLSMAALRVSRAWIGGFGVAPEHRRRGLATRLMQAHLERIGRDAAEVWLEVIAENPAREVYRRCGFAETRELLMFEGEPAAGEAWRNLDADTLRALHARLNPVRPTWRRDWPSVEDGLAEGAVAIGPGTGEAYAVVLPGERLAMLDAGAADEAAGRALFAAVAARWPRRPLRLVDEPVGSPLARAAEACGLTIGLRQFEMLRR